MIARRVPQRSSRANSLCAIFISAILLAAVFAVRAASADAPKNLLQNGDFAKGSEDQPDLWRTEAWINSPEAFQAHWHFAANQPDQSELEVDNLQANDARWMQPLTLAPGWYQLSVDIRTENVGAKETGATISIMEDGIMSPDVHGTTDWQRVTLYLKVAGKGADVDVALRVGGFGSLNTGKAWFRNATLLAISAPPPSAAPTYDLMAIRQQGAAVPSGSTISLVLTFMMLAGFACVGWRIYGDDDFRIFNTVRAAMAPRSKKR